MDPTTKTDSDQASYELQGSPLPIIHKDFHIGMRDTAPTTAMVGEAVDTLQASLAARRVSEKAEDLLLNGWPASINSDGDSYSLYGYTTHPDRNTGTQTDWSTAGNIRDQVLAMIEDLENDSYYAGNTGYDLFLSRNNEQALRAPDPDGDGNLTVRDRVEQLSEIANIYAADFLDSSGNGEAVLVKPIEEVVDLAIAEDLQTVQWESYGGMKQHFKVMMAMTPKVKSTRSNQSGIAHYS
jgi:hypothetical protein